MVGVRAGRDRDSCDPRCSEGEACINGRCIPVRGVEGGDGDCDPKCKEWERCVRGVCEGPVAAGADGDNY